MHKSNTCPMYMAENGQWSSSMSPWCTCDKNNDCIAPSHTWEIKGTTSPVLWVCKNCGKVSNLVRLVIKDE